MNLDFLKGLEVAAGEKAAKGTRKINRTPETGDILILKNGEIHFTEELKTKLDKQFVDLVFLTECYEFKAPEGQEGLFFVPIEADSAKASIREKTGSKLTFVKDVFIPALKERLDIDLDVLETVEFKVHFDQEIKNENGIFHFKKLQSSGKNKGTVMPIRRENVTMFPMTLVETVAEAVQQELPFKEGESEKEEKEFTGIAIENNEAVID